MLNKGVLLFKVGLYCVYQTIIHLLFFWGGFVVLLFTVFTFEYVSSLL